MTQRLECGCVVDYEAMKVMRCADHDASWERAVEMLSDEYEALAERIYYECAVEKVAH